MSTEHRISDIEEAALRILTQREPLAEELARRARAIEAAVEPAQVASASSTPGVIITEDAERELFARVARIARDEDEEELMFFAALDRAMTKALARNDDRIWFTQTMKRFGCRLHFLRRAERTFLVACAPLEGYST